MMKITGPEQFAPYQHSALFKKLYSYEWPLGRVANVISLRRNTVTRPLVIADRAEAAALFGQRQHDLLFDVLGKPAYFCENNGMTTYAIAEGIAFGVLEKDLTLLHFDAHPDTSRMYEQQWPTLDAPTLAQIYQSHCRSFEIDEWLWNLVGNGVVTTIIWFKSSTGPNFLRGTTEEIRKAFPGLKVISVNEEQLADFDRQLITERPPQRLVTHICWDYFRFLETKYMFTITDLIKQSIQRSGLWTNAWSPEYVGDLKRAQTLAVDLIHSLTD